MTRERLTYLGTVVAPPVALTLLVIASPLGEALQDVRTALLSLILALVLGTAALLDRRASADKRVRPQARRAFLAAFVLFVVAGLAGLAQGVLPAWVFLALLGAGVLALIATVLLHFGRRTDRSNASPE